MSIRVYCTLLKNNAVKVENALVKQVGELLTGMGIDPASADWTGQLVILGLIVLLSVTVGAVCRYAIIPAVQRIVERTRVTWDDELFNTALLRRFVRPVILLLSYTLLPLAFESEAHTLTLMQRVCEVAMVVVVSMFLNSLLKTSFSIIGRRESMQDRPLKGVLQILQITLYLIATIVIVSVIIQQSPKYLLTGLGASAALMMLIFKDSITGLVSGVQLSANNMLRPGDWITMPKYNADGVVIDVTLNTVKVRNFDNTITTIPPYALTSDSFQNWRGMQESAGRRIKRSISIDMNSVKFCTREMLEKYRRVALLTKYIDDKQAELDRYNHENALDASVAINERRQTNIGVFRAYLDRYLASLPTVNHGMTCMVRQLQPTENGIPIELYFFSAIKEWEAYERVQADVFDHVMSVIPEFDLRVFQTPTGYDMRHLAQSPPQKE